MFTGGTRMIQYIYIVMYKGGCKMSAGAVIGLSIGLTIVCGPFGLAIAICLIGAKFFRKWL